MSRAANTPGKHQNNRHTTQPNQILYPVPPMTQTPSIFNLPDDSQPVRLDRYVADQLAQSRAQVRKLLEAGAILLNHQTIDKPGTMLQPGDVIQIDNRILEQSQNITPNANLHIPVLYENDNLLIVNKPAGLGVHPLNPQQTDTVLNGLITQYPQIQGVGEGALRSGVVHRLDVSTTGTLIIALTTQGYNIGRRAITSKEYTLKRYRAIIHGKPKRDTMAVHRNLIIAQHQPAKVRVIKDPTTQSRPCSMRYALIRAMKETSDISIDLFTGFLHQIRVMMADLGHPIVGDTLYGSTRDDCRVLLHAQRLKFGDIDVTAPIPDEMKNAFD